MKGDFWEAYYHTLWDINSMAGIEFGKSGLNKFHLLESIRMFDMFLCSKRLAENLVYYVKVYRSIDEMVMKAQNKE